MPHSNAMQPTAASELAVPSSLRSSAAADGKRSPSFPYAVANSFGLNVLNCLNDLNDSRIIPSSPALLSSGRPRRSPFLA